MNANRARTRTRACTHTNVQGSMLDDYMGGLMGEQVDMAAVLLGTLAHCTDNGAALKCFQQLARWASTFPWCIVWR